MATQSSFKQQCPSCEAMVPIRDPKLIGRKIDCPKCKYRFVVEEPADEVEEAEEAAPAKKAKGGSTAVAAKKPAGGKGGARRPDDDEDIVDDPKAKKKQGGSGMLVFGIVLAAVAVIALAVGGVFLFTGDSSDDAKPSSRPSASAAPKSTSDSKPAEETKKLEAPKGIRPLQEDITNLLPNDSQIVINLPMDKLVGHARVKQAMLMTAGAFHETAFQNVWGIVPSDVRRVMWAGNARKKTIFSVMRTSAPLNEKKIADYLKLKPEAKVGGSTYYLVNRPLDALSSFLLKFDESHSKVALHFMDPITVVCADVGPMTQFLQDKGQPKKINKPAGEEKPAEGGRPGMPPGAPAGKPTAMISGSGGPQGRTSGSGGPQGGKPPAMMSGAPGGFQPPNGMPQGMMRPGMSQGGVGGSTSDAAPVSTSYLTIDPDLKAVLDQVEKVDDKEGQSVLLSFAWIRSVKIADALHNLHLSQVPSSLRELFSTVVASSPKALGMGVTEFDDAKVSLNFGAAYRDDKSAQAVQSQAETVLADTLPEMGLDLVSKTNSNNNNSRSGMMSGMPGNMPPGMPGGMSGNMSPGMRGGTPSGMSSGMMGGRTPPNPPGTPGGGGSPAFPGGNPARPQPGGGTYPPMQPPGPPGGFPGARPGTTPAATQPADDKAEAKGKHGDYHTWTSDNVAALGVNGNLTKSLFDAWALKIDLVCIRLRGVMAMSDRRSHIHELAEAMQKYLEKEGHFPRGAMPRSVDSRRFLDWRPDQRLSWMTQLLPYLSEGEFKSLKFDNDKGWYEGSNNLRAAVTVIPEFVAPSASGASTFFVPYPNIPVQGDWAATHFVGMAGVGLDAAEYRGDDPAIAKLRGVFGYDRATKKADIKDGLDQTIVLIQVPSSPKSPWIAGGGSTVRGVSEDLDCVKPFVCLEYQGKRGTLAVMADGKVRFIPASIDPKTFQALCTIDGGDKVRDLDKIAPEVPLPEGPEEQPQLKTDAPPPPVSPTETEEKPAGWTEYTSKEGGFTVHLPPGKTRQQDQQTDSPAGKVTTHIHGVELPDNVGAFLAAYTEVPINITAADADKVLDAAKVGASAFMKGAKITSETKITMEGHPGREWAVDVSGQGKAKARLLVVKNRLIQLWVVSESGKVNEKDVQIFFDSFKLNEK